MSIGQISVARERLQVALVALEDSHKTWSECVTSLHMAELQLRTAQKNTRLAYDTLCEALNHTTVDRPGAA